MLNVCKYPKKETQLKFTFKNIWDVLGKFMQKCFYVIRAPTSQYTIFKSPLRNNQHNFFPGHSTITILVEVT